MIQPPGHGVVVENRADRLSVRDGRVGRGGEIHEEGFVRFVNRVAPNGNGERGVSCPNRKYDRCERVCVIAARESGVCGGRAIDGDEERDVRREADERRAGAGSGLDRGDAARRAVGPPGRTSRGVRPGFFSDPVNRCAPAVRKRIEAAMRETSRKITTG